MVAAVVQAVMNEAIAQFAPYAQSGVPTFGGDSGRFGKLDPFNLQRDADTQSIPVPVVGGGVDSATTSSASAAAAGAEIVSTPYTHVDLNILVGGLVETEWGNNVADPAHELQDCHYAPLETRSVGPTTAQCVWLVLREWPLKRY